MDPMAMILIKALILGAIVTGFLGFIFIKVVSKSTETSVSRLNRETEVVRGKQAELNQKIKEANEELQRRRKEADELLSKMKTDAESTARGEREQIVNKARAEAEEIIAKAQKTKEDMRKALEKDLELKAIDFMVILADEIFSAKVRTALNHDLIDEFLDSLQKVDMSMVNDAIGEAEVVSVGPLEEKFKLRVGDILKKKLGRPVELKLKEDKKILAGIVIRFESLRLDGSLANIMKEKGVEMKERLERGLL